MAEAELAAPVKAHLERQGYLVRSEVEHCDLVGSRDDELVVVELKQAFNVEVLVQAVRRQLVTDRVYVAVPRPPKGLQNGTWRGRLSLLRRLELGLMLVGKAGRVDVLLDPATAPRRQRRLRRDVLREIAARSADLNVGGTTGVPLMTAYRERSLLIACILQGHGALPPRQVTNHGGGDRSQAVLYRNYYGWFFRPAEGVYELSDSGKGALRQYRGLVSILRKKVARPAGAKRKPASRPTRSSPRERG